MKSLITNLCFAFVVFTKIYSQNPIEVKATITNVTIYTSAAEIHFENNIQLKKGKNTIVFTDITPFVVENSTKVGVSDKSVNIITVTDKKNHLKTKRGNVSLLKDSVEKNIEEIGLINCRIEALEKEKSLLFNNESIGGVAKGVAVSEIEKADRFFADRYLKINLELFDLQKRKNKLVSKNEAIELQMSQITTVNEETITEVTVVVNSPESKNVTFDLSILTPNAGWAPIYDLKFNGPDKDLDFVFRANVFNASNFDWNDVKIKLSTASPTSGFNIPSLNDKQKQTKENINYQDQNIEFMQIQTNNILAEYAIDFSYSIPSDGKPYLVDVTKFSMPSDFSYIVIPKLDNNGFLMANIPNWNKYNLISGKTNVYNKGTFMGKTFLNTITENDTLNMYLGKDNNIEAYRKENLTENDRKFIGNFYVERNRIDLKIKNNYGKSVIIKLMDQVPVYESSDKVKMNITNIETADFDQKDGIITWKFNLNQGETREMNFGYTIKEPKEISESGQKLRRKQRRVTIPAPNF